MKLPLEIIEPLSSDVDWCEPNYVVSVYITEFWNTISNIPMLILPIILKCLYKDYPKHVPGCDFINIVWTLLVVVGLGSVLFHSTLSLLGQFLDEISIAWVCCSFIAVWFPNCHLPLYFQKRRNVFQLLVFASAALITYLCALKPEINQFALMIFVIPAFGYIGHAYTSHSSSTFHRICKQVFAIWTASLICWGVDKFLCPVWLFVHFPYFHGFWHILVIFGTCNACACYSFNYALEQVPHKQPALKFYSFFKKTDYIGLWYVTFNEALD